MKARPSEHQIAAPIDTQPTEAWDSTASASPYVFNCSIRSNYGLCGIFADGADVGGFQSFVTAQFTGVSLQKDLNAWQVYKGGSWVKPADYDEYISYDPDDVRMNPKWTSRHITAVNDAFIQEVSVFAIGQGIHHHTESGGEITITNSNSSFGGCAAVSKGYKNKPFPLDKNWNVSKIKVPTNLTDTSGNVKQVTLGTIDNTMANNATVLSFVNDLQPSLEFPTVPEVLAREGYTLKPDSYIWVENPVGPDFRAKLAATPYDPATPGEIVVKSAFVNEDGNVPGEEISSGPPNPVAIKIPDIKGKRVYIRRLVDTRNPDQRRISLLLGNTGPTRSTRPGLRHPDLAWRESFHGGAAES